MSCCERYRNVPALSKKDPLDAAMFMIQEIGVAPVPGDGFYQEGKFGDECVFQISPFVKSTSSTIRYSPDRFDVVYLHC